MSTFRYLHTVHVQPACINNAGWNKRDGYYENNINTGFYISRFWERKRGVESFKYIIRLKIAIDI
ncbi:TPA_asm: hypothetical protein GNC10_004651 [Salmonella enterica subsp. salamae serovar 42:z:1,5]|uniref:Uncharacterized protein n=10 Tax=Salmonella enterica subsp. salamae TaxID=59202 RepID=A0A5Y3MXU8_SALER|nr:hypothetical protein [Salmonella enterica subsp. salamae]EAB2013564.1 hypothetical protein [Salmonella enterica]EBI0477266.1 hypothetical protein [Salmonella enterica subsp. enterica serovar Braenderup]ECG1421380.1 hypothetical protein [Salmonella enterica subsp. salamae str. CFSAN000559]ECT8652347.1 hypothetical protein [Salmonella enterica subsp. salamae serovar 50:b:z6]EEJ4593132.1 hypothetical protein [Salmonella enterica subsp. salamae serovar 47:b:e,n,x,z15]EEJ9247689.1 hypothetical 